MKPVNDPALHQEMVQQSGMGRHFSHNLFSLSQLFRFGAGDYVIEEEKPSRYLFILVRGRVKAQKLGEKGKLIPYGYIDPVCFLGEVSSMWEEAPYMSIRAAEEVYCLGISLAKHRGTLLEDNRFLRCVYRQMCQRVMDLDKNLAGRMMLPEEARLASFLLQNVKGGVLQRSLLEGAEATGTSYRHLLRMMNDLRAQGLVEKRGRQYLLLDTGALQRLSTGETPSLKPSTAPVKTGAKTAKR